MKLNLKIWRQAGPNAAGRLVDYVVDDVSPDMSFLEMLDVVNEGLVKQGQDAIAFDSDCREGICGTRSSASRSFAKSSGTTSRCRARPTT